MQNNTNDGNNQIANSDNYNNSSGDDSEDYDDELELSSTGMRLSSSSMEQTNNDDIPCLEEESFCEDDKKDVKKYGRIIYPNGSTYEGELINNSKDGYGKLTKTDGYLYFGYWKDDKKNGKGFSRQINGSTYDGYWKDDLYDGYGVYNNPSQNKKCIGTFKKGKLDGRISYESNGIIKILKYEEGKLVENIGSFNTNSPQRIINRSCRIEPKTLTKDKKKIDKFTSSYRKYARFYEPVKKKICFDAVKEKSVKRKRSASSSGIDNFEGFSGNIFKRSVSEGDKYEIRKYKKYKKSKKKSKDKKKSNEKDEKNKKKDDDTK